MPSGVLVWLPAVVSVVGALTSVGGLAITVYKGTQEWKKWKRERHTTKRGEVAAEVLVACLRFLTGLQEIASPWITGESPEEEEPEGTSERERRQRSADRLGKILLARWDRFAATSTAFVEAWERAEVFLPATVIDHLDEIWKARASIYANQNMHVSRGREGSDDTRFFEGALGTDVRKNLERLREKSKELLRPMAQLQSD